MAKYHPDDKYLTVYADESAVVRLRMKEQVGWSVILVPEPKTNRFLFEIDLEDGSPADPFTLYFASLEEAKAAYKLVLTASQEAQGVDVRIDKSLNPHLPLVPKR